MYLHEHDDLDGVTVVFSSFSSDFVGFVVASPKAPISAGLAASGSGSGSEKSSSGSSVRGSVDLCLSSASFAPPARSKISSSTSRTSAAASLSEKSVTSSSRVFTCLSDRCSSSSSCCKPYEGVVELIWSSIVNNNFTPLYKSNLFKTSPFDLRKCLFKTFFRTPTRVRQVQRGPKPQKRRNCLTRETLG